jgi:multimeric flavodoxin WrbA
MLAIYGGFRCGNSQGLLEAALMGAEASGAAITRLYIRDLKIAPCQGCGLCQAGGGCGLSDDMDAVYPLLLAHRVIVLAMPIYFYGPPAGVKALIDRCQALWLKTRAPLRGSGYLLAVGASRGRRLFEPSAMICKYFYQVLGLDYGGGLFFRGLEAAEDFRQRPEHQQNAKAWGAELARKHGPAA